MADIRDALEYFPETGIFLWKISPSQGVKAGDVAGTKEENRYVIIGYRGVLYRAHRLAWFFIFGVFPEFDLDHEDGDVSNNRIKNLRPATEAQNLWNRKLCTRNKSGVKGVFWYVAGQKWAAQIRKNGVKYFLGYYASIDEAEKVVREARERLHGSFANHGVPV